jgi:L-seryl-tRNA(Ser) seleniumtransferase
VKELLRKIPKVDELLKQEEFSKLEKDYPQGLCKDVLRQTLERLRTRLIRGEICEVPSVSAIIDETRQRLEDLYSSRLRRVINGTGVIIHTNLGRSLLPRAAKEAIEEVASFYSNLEYDLDKGKRGERYMHVREVAKRILGAEDVLVVNNNAAAVLLVLNTLSEGKEVLISRGELIEIGGSFRMPDVMRKSGAILKEVGTTNRTYPKDYEEAITERTGLLMKAHTSNYRIEGFVHHVDTQELVSLAARHGLPTYLDAGSGLLVRMEGLGGEEPVIREEVRKGIDVVSFSGDKILGGPQAGIIVGRSRLLEMLKRNPLLRALRPDKFTISALEATFRLYEDIERNRDRIPTLRMIFQTEEVIRRRARKIVRILRARCRNVTLSVVPVESEIGGGSFPDLRLPSFAVGMRPNNMSTQCLEERLRRLPVPIIARIQKGMVLIDMRTVQEEDEPLLLSGIEKAQDA